MGRSPFRRVGQPRTARHRSVTGLGGAAKRAFDALVAGMLLAVGWPLGLLIALAVRATSPGPALYRQTRLGIDGRPFTILKFRTMKVGAEPNGRAVWAVDDDPRCTAVGGVLRRLGLDELPQLWNVLLGDMSLVGPRPERPEFARGFGKRWPGFARRLTVRGGITGLAQVRGLRGDTDVGARLRSDLEYIQRWSLAFDLAIIARTIPSVLVRERAAGGGSDRLAGTVAEEPGF